MKIASINAYSSMNYAKKRGSVSKHLNPNGSEQKTNQVSFQGDRGTLLGMAGGALLGLGAVALALATGGLAAPIVAAGASSLAVGGTGFGAQIGGIAGGIIEDKINDKKK